VTVRRLLFWALILLPAALPRDVDARVVRFVVEQRRPLAGGHAFGDVGPYERLDGTAHMEVDPRDPLNAVIVNLDKAPRNARGMVEFSSPFYILKPVDLARGNGKLFYGINNRGNSIELARFNLIAPGANTSDPLGAAAMGDGFLMRLGYTIVDAGWQGDVEPGSGRLAPTFPVARQADGSPIVARVRVEYSDRTIPQAGTFTLPLEGSPAFRPYATADRDTTHSTLVVRDGVSGERKPVAPDRWAFGRCPAGRESLAATSSDICLFDGFRADRLYELIYPAKDPIVMGLGHAVTRDIGSFLRYDARDAAGTPNPLASSSGAPGMRRAYATGSSQTGIYLRDLIYLGFNEDESHRKVFDAVNINIAGSVRNFINVEFAGPNTYSAQMDRHDFLMTSYPPLTYAVTTDPISGVRAGILQRPATDPLVVDTHTETEYYQLRASLNLTDGRGQPVSPPDTVRMYLLSNLQHGSGRVGGPLAGPRGMCEYPTNGVPAAGVVRALLVAMDAWVERGTAPPPSRVPDVRNGTLVPLSEARAAFPAIPGVRFSPALNELELLNFGPEFRPEGGRVTLLPPIAGPRYTVLVPKPDADGLDLAGVRVVETAVPLGTATGWNIRGEGFRPGNTCGLSGAYFPFARTRAERQASGDPRRSLEERYTDHGGYVKAIEHATRTLVKERLLLPEDAERYVRDAKASDVLK
jgi:hypothetical protein